MAKTKKEEFIAKIEELPEKQQDILMNIVHAAVRNYQAFEDIKKTEELNIDIGGMISVEAGSRWHRMSKEELVAESGRYSLSALLKEHKLKEKSTQKV